MMTEVSALKRKRKIEFLEAVRGIAAAIVVIQHVLAANFPTYLTASMHSLDLGRVGVVAFFLVSGYVIPLSLKHQSVGVFAARRFYRLYPVYWVALGLFCFIHNFTGVIPGQTPLAVLTNIFMVQGLIGLASILPPAWTLSLELVFYGQAVAAKILRISRFLSHAGWFWLALYLLLCVAARLVGKDLPITFPLLLFVASVGHSVYLRDQRMPNNLGRFLWVGAFVIPVGSVFSVDPAWPPFTYTLSAFCGFALFFAMWLLRSITFPTWTQWLGGVSYAIYLFHPIVADLLHYILGLPTWLVVLLDFTMVPVVGFMVHKFIEQPSIRLGVATTKAWTLDKSQRAKHLAAKDR